MSEPDVLDDSRWHEPFISVIVPTFARPQQLAECLEALAQQEYPPDRFEVIVVDDGSEDPPADVISALSRKINVRLIVAPHGGPAAARNMGAAQASGTSIAFTDDDCRPARSWLSALATYLVRHPEHAVGGRVVNALTNNQYSETSQLLVSYLYEYYDGQPQHFFCSDNIALSAERFRALGGFDAAAMRITGEDRDLCERWLYAGNTLAYLPEAVVHHSHHLTFRTFLRQHWRYDRDALDVHRGRRARNGTGAEVRLGFYLGLVLYAFRQDYGLATPLYALLLVASQLAYVAGLLGRYVEECACLVTGELSARLEVRFD